MAELGGDPAVVVGAGPYGLAVAAHLRARNVPVRVFGEPMGSWRQEMPTGMFLTSTPRESGIAAPRAGYTLADYRRRHGLPPPEADEPVPVDLFIRYGRWFQQHLVRDVERTRVAGISRHRAGIEVTLDTGERIRTGAVVVATGLAGQAYLPRTLAALVPDGPSPAGPVSHSCQYGGLSALAGADVVVVGAGQSALESAVLLHEAGARAQVVARRRVVFADPPQPPGARRWSSLSSPPSPLGPGWRRVGVSTLPGLFRYLPGSMRGAAVQRVLDPTGAWWLRDRFVGRVPVRSGQQIVNSRLDGRRVELELVDGRGERSTISADHVIAATGYRVSVDKLTFIDGPTRAAVARIAGSPLLDRFFMSTVPGLYFPGVIAAATFGPLQRFLSGTGFAAARVSAAVAGRTGSRMPGQTIGPPERGRRRGRIAEGGGPVARGRRDADRTTHLEVTW